MPILWEGTSKDLQACPVARLLVFKASPELVRGNGNEAS